MSHLDLDTLLAHRLHPDPEVQRHLESCERCRSAAAQVHEALEAVAQAPPALDEAAIEARVAAVVDEALDEPAVAPPRSRRRWALLWVFGLSTAAAAAIGASVYLARPAPAPAPRPAPVEAPAPDLARPPTPTPPVATPVAAPVVAPAPAPVVPPDEGADPMPAPVDDLSLTLFREASDALAAGRVEEARGLLLILAELHPDLDVRALRLVEMGLTAFDDDPEQAIQAFEAAVALDPDGPLADDCARWLCELAPGERCP